MNDGDSLTAECKICKKNVKGSWKISSNFITHLKVSQSPNFSFLLEIFLDEVLKVYKQFIIE